MACGSTARPRRIRWRRRGPAKRHHRHRWKAEAHLLLGRLYLRAGRDEAAVQALKIAIWSEESAEAHAALGEAYLALEDPAAARVELERAVALNPRSPDAARLKARLPPAR